MTIVRLLFAVTLAAIIAACPALADERRVVETDLCIYGGTSGGVIAAVQAARLGRRAFIIEPGRHLGGMTASGLGAVDIGDPRAVGGIAREYFTRLTQRYEVKLTWEDRSEAGSGGTRGTGGRFATEPHAAEELFRTMADEAGVRVLYERRLASVDKEGARIRCLKLADGTVVEARVFIDASYEGDLLAAAGVSYTVGRESNSTYGETLNGIQPPAKNRSSGKFEFPVDPYVVPGDPASGVLPLVQHEPYGEIGAADDRIQAYNYRLCLTDVAENRLPIEPPANYREENFELVARSIAAQMAAGKKLTLADFCKYDRLPNGKYDFNNRWPISTDCLGGSREYPEATPERRLEIEREHENYLRGFFHFLAHSSRSPEAVRRLAQTFGLAKDEFTDNGGWPHQIYVREARRMVSDFVMVEQHCRGERTAPHSIGLGAYRIDIHAARRIPFQGRVVNEGSNGGSVPRPYPIAYGSIVPTRTECENLLVPFCLSASHVAFGSIRMEPVFMVLSQSAATAACLAIENSCALQDVGYGELRKRLVAQGQVLDWPPAVAARAMLRHRAADTTELETIASGGALAGTSP